MNKMLRNSLIGAVLIVGGYQVYKKVTKPKQAPKPEQKSNFISYGGAKKSALVDGLLKYDSGQAKVYKWRVTPNKSEWVMLGDAQQPKAMSWYSLNGKWIWTKWNGKLDV